MITGSSFYMPDWLQNGQFSQAELASLLEDLIKSLMQSNGNGTKVEIWNVLNEVIMNYHIANRTVEFEKIKFRELGNEPDQSGLTGSAKIVSEFPKHIALSLEIARKYTSSKLSLRDNNIEFIGEFKSEVFYQIVKHLIGRKAPLDAIDLQGHFDVNKEYDWSRFTENIKRYKKLGFEVYLSEIDIGDTQLSWNDQKADKQRKLYQQMVEASRNAGVDGIFTWGLKDGNPLWLQGQKPLLFDENYSKKPAYAGYLQGLINTKKFSIRARGSCGGERLIRIVNGRQDAEWFLSKHTTEYTSTTNITSSDKVLVAYTNDGSNLVCDQNVHLDQIEVNGKVYSSSILRHDLSNAQTQICGMSSNASLLNCNAVIAVQ
jgi:GH35 family endo-1,4-beta-xylanase